jgi:riboflavin synthase
MLQSLNITTLGQYKAGDTLNVERAAKDGAEIGGHPLSGHVDFTAPLLEVMQTETNHKIRFGIPEAFRPYVFAKGYIAVNGASLTVAEVNRKEGWFEVWLIPETLRMTVLATRRWAIWSISRSSAARRSWSIPCVKPWKPAWAA